LRYTNTLREDQTIFICILIADTKNKAELYSQRLYHKKLTKTISGKTERLMTEKLTKVGPGESVNIKAFFEGEIFTTYELAFR